MRTSAIVLFSQLIFSLLLGGQTAENNGIVYGKVINMSKDNAPVPEQEVILYQYKNGQKIEDSRVSTVTDNAGEYVFKALEINEALAYYPITVYAELEYNGALVKPDSSALRQQSNIFVFEPTSSDTAISVSMHHIIIEPGVGVLNVREVYFFTNKSKYTIVGNEQVAPEKKKVLELETPANANELQLGGDLMMCCAVQKENKIFDTMEFKPGSRQVVLSYAVPYDGKRTKLTKEILYPTESFDVFLDNINLSKFTVQPYDDGTNPAAIEITDAEPFKIRDKIYNRYLVGKLSPQSVVTLAMVDLPNKPTDYKIIAPFVLVLIIVVFYFLNRRGRSSRQQD